MNIVVLDGFGLNPGDLSWSGFEKLLSAPDAYVIFAGDQMEMATRSSKSDVYTQTMRPHEQKVWWKDHLLPFKDKIIAIVDGNHEFNRASKDADMYPLYDIAFALGIENRYRSECAFVDIGVGKVGVELYGVCVVRNGTLYVANL